VRRGVEVVGGWKNWCGVWREACGDSVRCGFDGGMLSPIPSISFGVII
jgi:hypothetical protein